jgi:hypothetical protein
MSLFLSFFLDIISFFSGSKSCFSETEYFLCIVGAGLYSVVFRVFNEGLAERGKKYLELIPEVEGAKIGAICFHKRYIFAGIRNGEEIFRQYVAVERINTR